ncbi:MAG: TetR/AcrR family transcriptional regulator [Rhodobacteraceae bacterium]|nr:TetR/AcrR family transcriptional regulator [Paracoccaceae bacterium]
MTAASAPTTDSAPPLAARERILDAAEAAFARDGFAGAGMKAIAIEAGVAQGLLHYHFGSKEGLYSAVVARRSARINDARAVLLEQVDFAAPDALVQVFAALVGPPLGPEGGGVDYARIFALLAVGGARDQDLVRAHYDDNAHRFIAAIRRAEPRASHEHATWAYCFAIGALVSVVARDGRPERLAAGEGAPPDPPARVAARLARHCAGGLRGLLDD